MTKLAWQKHWQEIGPHDTKECSICAERRKTQKRNRSARARDEAYRSCGLVKVRGALGRTYWE